MFKKLFKDYKKNNENFRDSEKESGDKPEYRERFQNLDTQKDDISGCTKLNLKGQEQFEHEGMANVENINSNEEIVTIEKPAKKAVEKMIEYKLFYKDKFKNCKNINEVLETYIEYTDPGVLLNDLRLRYVGMYLFNTSLSNDRLSIDNMKSLLIKKILVIDKDETDEIKEEQALGNKTMHESVNPGYKSEESVRGNSFHEVLYEDLKVYIKKEISLYKQFKRNMNADAMLLSIFSRYGMEAADSDLFIRTLLKLIEDMDLPKIETKGKDIRKYLKQRILNIIDTDFWEEDEEKLYRCDLFIVGRHIRVNAKDFYHVIFNAGEGPIYVDVLPLSHSNRFSVKVGNDIFFVMNTADKNKLLDYFNYINSEVIEEAKEKVWAILGDVYSTSPYLVTIIRNFLKMMPLDILLNKDNYIAFEHLISLDNFIAQQMLDSSTEHRNNIIDMLKKDTDFYNNINHFIEDSYKKLVKIVGEHIKSPERYHSPVIWKLIRIEAIYFISEYYWNNEYGGYIKTDTEVISLDEYVDIYCRSSDIPTKNIFAVGSFTYYLMRKRMFPKEINENFIKCNIFLIGKIMERIEELDIKAFKNRLMNGQVQKGAEYTIHDVDLMDGYEFEQFVGLIFTKMGYMIEITKGSGDQGLDVIAEKSGNRIGIQAKCYSNKVTNKAIQEIFTALNYYNCDKGIVVTNNYFTDSALDLAQSNNIVLWDRDILKKKIDEVFN